MMSGMFCCGKMGQEQLISLTDPIAYEHYNMTRIDVLLNMVDYECGNNDTTVLIVGSLAEYLISKLLNLKTNLHINHVKDLDYFLFDGSEKIQEPKTLRIYPRSVMVGFCKFDYLNNHYLKYDNGEWVFLVHSSLKECCVDARSLEMYCSKNFLKTKQNNKLYPPFWWCSSKTVNILGNLIENPLRLPLLVWGSLKTDMPYTIHNQTIPYLNALANHVASFEDDSLYDILKIQYLNSYLCGDEIMEFLVSMLKEFSFLESWNLLLNKLQNSIDQEHSVGERYSELINKFIGQCFLV